MQSKEFRAAEEKLKSLGFVYICTVMASNAQIDSDETDFGKLFSRSDRDRQETDRFYLNYKTIGNLPS